MRRKRSTPASRATMPTGRGSAVPGRLTYPLTGPSIEGNESTPDLPRSAPMPGTPLPAAQMDRLKQNAKSSQLPAGVRAQPDPAVKK